MNVMIWLACLLVDPALGHAASSSGLVSPNNYTSSKDHINPDKINTKQSSINVRNYIPVSNCLDNPCINGGRCTQGELGYICQCRDGFYGKHCEGFNPCFPNPCRHGTCSLSEDGYMCTCFDGFLGKRCEAKNRCYPNPCHNEGSCVNQAEGPICTCKRGFTGQLCMQESKCEPINPCMNNGICQDKVSYYHCICQPDFSGPNCEFQPDLNHSGRKLLVIEDPSGKARQYAAESIRDIDVKLDGIQQTEIMVNEKEIEDPVNRTRITTHRRGHPLFNLPYSVRHNGMHGQQYSSKKRIYDMVAQAPFKELAGKTQLRETRSRPDLELPSVMTVVDASSRDPDAYDAPEYDTLASEVETRSTHRLGGVSRGFQFRSHPESKVWGPHAVQCGLWCLQAGCCKAESGIKR